MSLSLLLRSLAGKYGTFAESSTAECHDRWGPPSPAVARGDGRELMQCGGRLGGGLPGLAVGMLSANAACGGQALADQERPVVRVCPDGPRGQAGRRQVETPGREKYAKLCNAGGACCSLVEVLDSTLRHWCARPEKGD